MCPYTGRVQTFNWQIINEPHKVSSSLSLTHTHTHAHTLRYRYRGSDVTERGRRGDEAFQRARWQQNPMAWGSLPVSPSCTTWTRRPATRMRWTARLYTSATAATRRRATGAAGARVCRRCWETGLLLLLLLLEEEKEEEEAGGRSISTSRRSACGWTASGSFSRCSSSSGTSARTCGWPWTTTPNGTICGSGSRCSSCWFRRCWSRSWASGGSSRITPAAGSGPWRGSAEKPRRIWARASTTGTGAVRSPFGSGMLACTSFRWDKCGGKRQRLDVTCTWCAGFDSGDHAHCTHKLRDCICTCIICDPGAQNQS